MQRKAFLLLLACVALGAYAETPLETWTSAALAARVATTLRDQAAQANPGRDVSVDVERLDPRLTFVACAELSLSTQGGPYGRVTAIARCDRPRAWSAAIPATVSVRAPVAVLSHPLPRDARITSADVALEPRDLGTLHGDYATDVAAVTGWTAKRALDAGTVLSARYLKPAAVVARGDTVQISSARGSVAVHAAGTALGPGVAGEQISVRNLASDRIVRAWVTGPGMVSASPVAP